MRIAFLKIPNISYPFPIHRTYGGAHFLPSKPSLGFGQVELQLEPCPNPVSHGWANPAMMKNKKMTIFGIFFLSNSYEIAMIHHFFPWNFRSARSSLLQQLELWSKFLGRLFEVIVFHSEPLVVSSHKGYPTPRFESLSRGMGVMWHPKWRRGVLVQKVLFRLFCTNLAFRDCD